jgi:SAM-dependent methyltransferase
MTSHAIIESQVYDSARADSFAARMISGLNEGAAMLMISLGHRVGLFDALSEGQWLGAAEIAARSGLVERYVREWLGAMTTAGVVEYRADVRRWSLPAEHAACLTRASTPNNIAAIAQYLAVIGAVESEIADCFRSGQGLDYERYHRFHEVMAEDSAQTVVHALFETILPLVPGLADRLARGLKVADVGCGRGLALIALAERFPAAEFVGYDLCAAPIDAAAQDAAARGLANIRFEQRDLAADPLPGGFDLVTAFDAVHDQRDPAGLLRSIHDALAPGGVFLMQDIAGCSELHGNLDHPVAPLLYAISATHCTPVSLAQGGPGLGTMWGEELACEMLAEAGFRSVERRRLLHDFMNVYFICRKP